MKMSNIKYRKTDKNNTSMTLQYLEIEIWVFEKDIFVS